MKILLLEYITAGGLNDAPLPVSLLREGMLIRDALLRDFGALAEITTTFDDRLDKPTLQTQYKIHYHTIHKNAHPTAIWQTLLPDCDATLVVAPETDGILLHLTQLVEATTVINLGCNAASVKLTTSKLATCTALQEAGVATIPSYSAAVFQTQMAAYVFPNGYVVKPEDGAGCDHTWYFESHLALNAWLHSHTLTLPNYIVQPYQIGQAASFSILCRQGKAWLLACNTQKIEIDHASNHRFKYTGSSVNGLTRYHARFNQLAQAIAMAIPGLNGYVGVDVIIDENTVYVVEINPRITTSYIGLQQSLQYNPAALILSAAMEQDFVLPNTLKMQPVEIDLYA